MGMTTEIPEPVHEKPGLHGSTPMHASGNTATRADAIFLANMSHEFRTPLNAILGFSELLTKEIFGPLGDARYRSYAEGIFRSGTRLLKLVEALLEISELKTDGAALARTPVDVRAAIDHAIALTRSDAAAKRIVIRTELVDPCPTLLADPIALAKALSGALSAAVAAAPAGQHLTLGFEISRSGAPVLTLAYGPQPMLDAADALFNQYTPDPFIALRRAKGATYETGLTLLISRMLVEALGGQMKIESRPDHGAALIMRFPPQALGPARQPISRAAC